MEADESGETTARSFLFDLWSFLRSNIISRFENLIVGDDEERKGSGTYPPKNCEKIQSFGNIFVSTSLAG